MAKRGHSMRYECHEINEDAAAELRERFKPFLGGPECGCDLHQELSMAMGANMISVGKGKAHEDAARALVEAFEQGTHEHLDFWVAIKQQNAAHEAAREQEEG